MKAVVTVLGNDRIGILAKIATACSDCNANVLEVTQAVLGKTFTMTMLVDISALNVNLEEFNDYVRKVGEAMGMVTHVMHEDIFNSMHRI